MGTKGTGEGMDAEGSARTSGDPARQELRGGPNQPCALGNQGEERRVIMKHQLCEESGQHSLPQHGLSSIYSVLTFGRHPQLSKECRYRALKK